MHQQFSNALLAKLSLLVLGAGFLAGIQPSASAQTRAASKKPTARKPTSKAAPQKTSTTKAAPKDRYNAWTGIITCTRSNSASHNKSSKLVSADGTQESSFRMRDDYTAQVAVIEAPEKNGSSLAKANISNESSATEKTITIAKHRCPGKKTPQEMRGQTVSKSQTKGSASNQDAKLSISINSDGTYTVGVGFSPIKGMATGSTSSSYSGQCVPKKGSNSTAEPTEVTINGQSISSDGKNRLNPADPNHLSGSYSRKWASVTETISWDLRKDGAPLRLLELKFEQMKFPNWNDWQAIAAQDGTIDGNLVKIKATVVNVSTETQEGEVKIKETDIANRRKDSGPDGLLEGGEFPVKLQPGKQREVELVWDSSGYAWFDDGRPRRLQKFKAEIEEKAKRPTSRRNISKSRRNQPFWYTDFGATGKPGKAGKVC